jgi:two-component sensor histidine kinase
VGAAVAVALVEAAGLVSRSALEGRSYPWGLALRVGLGLWLTMAAVTPIPVVMAARFPLERGRLWGRLLLHAFAATVFVAAHLALDIAVQTLQGNMRPEPFGPHLGYLLGQYLAIEMLVYAAVAGAFMFVRARRDAEARARAAETLRAELGEARLAALHSQLAPHFLFNTLNAISTLAVKGERESVTRALSALAELLRAVLEERPGHQVALADELEFLERYLELQQLRFSDRLRVERSIAPETRDARVPWLLLQPIVENAVQHGLAGSEGGTVTLAARCEGGTLVLEVNNRAAGDGRAPASASRSAGIGLANARARLAQLYGDAQALELLPDAHGTTVRIRLPYVTRPGAHIGPHGNGAPH